MEWIPKTRRFNRALGRFAVLLGCLLLTAASLAQSAPRVANQTFPKPQAQAAVSALFISDIHFDPFWDPSKIAQLDAAPASQWRAILAAAPSPDRQKRFDELQQSCHARGVDTPFALFDASLRAMRGHAAGIGFVTVSGDLLAHAFACKYKAILPGVTPESYRSFTEKTLRYEISELDGNFPGVPVYVALGNNDSDCGDYRLDAHGEFLHAIGQDVTAKLPADERQAAQDNFAAGGYYSVALPAPLVNARLLVLNDIFMSSNYRTCGGKPDPAAAEEQLDWLRRQLAEARASKQKIWVMGHIPPGVDLHATVAKFDDVCGGQGPEMFLSSEKLADVLAGFGDVIELAIFAHTHMDELRLLKPESGGPAVAVKLVSSISPINGNHPSFTLARIDAATAALEDYKVFAAADASGASWSEEYDFARSYSTGAFSPAAVSKLIAGFTADQDARSQASQSYLHHFYVGGSPLVLQAFWPQYLCTLSNHSAQSFKACVCSAAK